MNKKKHYFTKEAASAAGISARTLYRWLKEGKIQEADRDRNNFRIFDEELVKEIKTYVNKVTPAPHKLQGELFPRKAKA